MVATAAWAATQMSATTFVQKAATDGMAEVELATAATKKSGNPAVKAYAQMLVDDHTKANEQLTGIAKKDGIAVPTALTAEQKAMAGKLSAKSGAAFDRAYIAGMVKDHEKAVALFKTAAADGQINADLRAFAKDTLPTLEQHLKAAQHLHNELSPQRHSAR